MQHFPIFLSTADQVIIVVGGQDAAMAKLRLLFKTRATLRVYATDATAEIQDWAQDGRLELIQRTPDPAELAQATLVYCALEDDARDAEIATLARRAGVLVNIVDNLHGSDFITPAIVDRDPVTIAIGTEGAAPVLARSIKADLEDRLPSSLGALATLGKAFRPMAEALPMGRKRREFWAEFYFDRGPAALARGGAAAVKSALAGLLRDHLAQKPSVGHVDFVGAGPGDPDLLTLKARKALHAADIVVHDADICGDILELARREAGIIATDGATTPMEIADLTRRHVAKGHHVVRLTVGDGLSRPAIAQEIRAAQKADLDVRTIPGVATPQANTTPVLAGLVLTGPRAQVKSGAANDAGQRPTQKERAL